jgi:hypothetical protein
LGLGSLAHDVSPLMTPDWSEASIVEVD